MSEQRLDTLFYEIEARTQQFDASIKRSATALKDLEAASTKATTSLPKVDARPITESVEQATDAVHELGDAGSLATTDIAAGAGTAITRFVAMAAAATTVAVALAAIVREAVQVASAIDGDLTAATNRLGEATGATEGWREEIRRLSDASGVTQEAIGKLFLSASDGGVVGAEAIGAVSAEVLRLRDALGTDGAGLGEQLARTASGFGILNTEAAAAALFQSAQGIANAEKFVEAISQLGPAAARAGVSFETTTAAVRALVLEGRSVGDASTEFERLSRAGDEGRRALEALGSAGIDYTKALTAYRSAQDETRESVTRLTESLKNRLRNELADLGSALLPTVYQGLKGVEGLLTYGGPLWLRFAAGVAAARAQLAGVKDGANGVGASLTPPNSGVPAGGSIGGTSSSAARDIRAIQDAATDLSTVGIRELRAFLATLNRVGTTAGLQRDEVAKLAKTIQTELSSRLRTAADDAKRQAKAGEEASERFDDAAAAALRYARALGETSSPLQNAETQQAAIVRNLDRLIQKVPALERAGAEAAKQNLLDELANGAERLRNANVAALGDDVANLLTSVSGTAIDEIIAQYDALIDRIDTLAARGEALGTTEAKATAQRAKDAIPKLIQERDAMIELATQRQRAADAAKTLENFGKQASANYRGEAVSLEDRNNALQAYRDVIAQLDENLAKGMPTLKARVAAERELDALREGLKNIEAGGSVAVVSATSADFARALGDGLAAAAQSGLTLVQVLGEGNSTLGAMLAGVGTLGKGIAGLGSLAKSAGGFGALFSGAGAAAALGPAAAVVGGLTAIAQATDLFGKQAKKRADALREAAVAFNAALDDFAITARTSLEESLKANIRNAEQVRQQALAANGFKGGTAITSTSDIRKQIAELTALGSSSLPVGVREQFLKLRDSLIALLTQTEKNEAALTALNAAEISRLQESLAVRRLAVQGLGDEADAARAKLALDEEERLLRDKYGDAAKEYIEDLKKVTAAEYAAFRAARERAEALSLLDDQLAILGGTAGEQLVRTLSSLASLFPELAGLGEGLDLGTTGGLDALKQRLRDLFQALSADGISESEAPLVAAIRRILGAIEGAAGALPPALDPFTAALEAFAVRVEVFGLNAEQQLEGLSKIFAGKFSGLDDILKNADLGSSAGRDALREQLLGAIDGILSDGVSTDAEAPFLEALQRFLGLVNTSIGDAANEALAARERARRAAGNRIALFDLEGLDALRATLGGYGAAFGDLFATFDLSTLDGVNAAKAQLRELLGDFDTLSDAEIFERFGLTRDELLAALLDADGGFDRLVGSLGDVAAKARAAAEAAADFTATLTQDFLRSQGRDQDADELAAKARRDERLKRAEELKLGADVLRQIQAVYEDDVRTIRERFAKVAADAAAAASPTNAQSVGGSPFDSRRSEFIASAVTAITSTQALRITDYLASSLVEQRGARLAVEQMVRLLGGVAGVPIPRLVVPPLPGDAGANAARGNGVFQLIVNFNGPLTGTTPGEAAEVFLQQAGPALNAYLARSAGIEAKASGRQLV